MKTIKTIDELFDEVAQIYIWIEHQRTHRSSLQSAAQWGAMIEAEEEMKAILTEIRNREH